MFGLLCNPLAILVKGLRDNVLLNRLINCKDRSDGMGTFPSSLKKNYVKVIKKKKKHYKDLLKIT